MYDMVCSRPDLSYVTSVVSAVRMYMANSGKEHWKLVQWISEYFRRSYDICLHFRRARDGFIGILTPILQETLIKEDLLLGVCLLLEVALTVGKLLCRLQLHCRPPR